MFVLEETPGISDTALEKKLTQSPLIGQVFHSLLHTGKNLPLVKGILEKEEIFPYDSYLHDDVLRTLYWKNLLCWKEKASDKYLVWRSVIIREAGKKIVGNYEKK